MTDDAFVDSHIHLFYRTRLRYSWLESYVTAYEQLLGDYRPLQNKKYELDDFLQDARPAGISKIVHVQAALGSAPVAETECLQKAADDAGVSLGIVADANLAASDVSDQLEAHAKHTRFRGIRMLSGAEVANSAEFRRGFTELVGRGLIYDVDAYPHQYDDIFALASDFPNATIVLEHAGLPLQRDRAYLTEWAASLKRIARAPNIHCKVSGLGMTDHIWNVDRIRPIVLGCIDAFAPERIFFGTNWPVDSLYGSTYRELVDAYREVIAPFSAADRKAMLSANAEALYSLS